MPESVQPPVSSPNKRGRARSPWPKTDGESLGVGLLLTLLIWPALIGLVQFGIGHFGRGHEGPVTPRAKPTFEIQMDPLAEISKQQPEAKVPERFIETNPDAPENTPDQTRNFSNRNQQVAQEKPAEIDKSDLPSTHGKKDFESNQIVSGSLTQPETTEPPPPPPPTDLMKALREEQQQQERNPLPGEARAEGKSETGYGFNLGKIPDNIQDIPQPVQGAKQAPLIVAAPQATAATPPIDPRRPMPRPRLEQKVRPAVLAERVAGTSNIGITGADAHWSQYGAYLQRLIDSVQIEWERILDTAKAYPPPGSTVKVKFRLEANEGLVSEIIEVDGNAGNQGTRACVSAITARAPYGKWTDDMIAVLGTEQELEFTFLYQ